MKESGALQAECGMEIESCKICRRKFANDALPLCEQSICPNCCAACMDGGCDEYC